jgi:hypothetical protein
MILVSFITGSVGNISAIGGVYTLPVSLALYDLMI